MIRSFQAVFPGLRAGVCVEGLFCSFVDVDFGAVLLGETCHEARRRQCDDAEHQVAHHFRPAAHSHPASAVALFE